MNEPRRGSVIAAGLLLSLLVAGQAARATFTPGGGLPLTSKLGTLLLLWAAASLLVVPIGLWIRRAPLQAAGSVDRALLLGTALSSLPLALFGGVLKSATHHRPLGGATFAVVACVVLTLCIALVLRLGRGQAAVTSTASPASGASTNQWLSRFFLVACLGSAAAALVLGLESRRALLDFVTLSAACAGAGLLKIPTKVGALPAALTGALWALLLSCGLLLTGRAELMSEARVRAPVSFVAFSWLGGGS